LIIKSGKPKRLMGLTIHQDGTINTIYALTYIAFEVCVCVCVFMAFYIVHINSQDWDTIMLLKSTLKVCVKFEKVSLRFFSNETNASSVSREN
jgi:hypothetical protein